MPGARGGGDGGGARYGLCFALRTWRRVRSLFRRLLDMERLPLVVVVSGCCFAGNMVVAVQGLRVRARILLVLFERGTAAESAVARLAPDAPPRFAV